MKTHITLSAFFLIFLVILFGCSLPTERSNPRNEQNENNFQKESPDSTLVLFIVIFDSQGGSPVDSQIVSEGSLLIEPEPPVLTGKIFVGWLNPSSGTFWDFSNDQVFSNLILYAQWVDCTEGLEYTLINGDTEYSVSKGTADTTSPILIPEYWNGKKVTAIGDEGFKGCDLLPLISLPESITYIGSQAFAQCLNLASMDIPDSVTHICDAAFMQCTSLTSITIPEGVTHISDYTFAMCSGLISVELPESVNTIGNAVFYSCYYLQTVKMPENAESMGSMVFGQCRFLEEISLPAGIPSIGEYTFANCTNLVRVSIPDVISIEQGAFFLCSSLVEIELLGSLESIGSMAFRSCLSLSTVTVHALVPPSIDNTVFQITNLSAILVPPGVVDDYKAASGWSDYSSIIMPQ